MNCHGLLCTAIIGLLAADFARCEGVRDIAFRYKVDPPSASILNRRVVQIFLRGNKPDITLTEIILVPNVALTSARPELGATLKGKNVTEGGDLSDISEVHLGDGKREVELLFEYPSGSGWSPLCNFELTQLEPGPQSLVFKAKAQTATAEAKPMEPLSESVEFNITAPTLSITLAGMAGAMTLALLRFLYRLRGGTQKMTLRVEAREALIAICAGGLIAFSLTYLGGLLSGSEFGIQISATSWKGGFIIGLFSYKIADLIAQKLWEKEKPPPP
jgi:hypothetical protein